MFCGFAYEHNTAKFVSQIKANIWGTDLKGVFISSRRFCPQYFAPLKCLFVISVNEAQWKPSAFRTS